MTEQKKRQLTVQMDDDLYESFKKAAQNNDRSMGLLVRDFAKEYIQKHKQGDLFKK